MDVSSTPPVTIMFIPRILSTPSAWPPVAWLSPIATRGLSAITSPCRVVGISSWEFAGSAQLSSRVTLAYPPRGGGWDLTPGELLDTSVCRPLNSRWRDRDFIMGICLLSRLSSMTTLTYPLQGFWGTGLTFTQQWLSSRALSLDCMSSPLGHRVNLPTSLEVLCQTTSLHP